MPDLSDGGNWSEIDSNNNNASPNGWPEGMMPSGVNDAARADKGALKRFWDRINPVQLITPSGGVYTFTTANPAYPTAYVEGEVYYFRPAAVSGGGDQFQVNALGIKPIWKRILPSGAATGWAPIIPQDILANIPAKLVYIAGLNAGAGAFVLVNPWVPISGDGAGGVHLTGSLTVDSWVDVGAPTNAGLETHGPVSVNGDLSFKVPHHDDKTICYIQRQDQAAGNRRIGITASGPALTYYPLEELWINATVTTMIGSLSATGYKSRSGINGSYQANNFNIQWDGAAAHLWIDSADIGPIVTGSGGNVVIGGNASVGSLTASGNISAGSISTTGSLSAGSISTAGNITAGSISTTGSLSAGSISTSGNMTVTGTLTAPYTVVGNEHVTGPLQVDGHAGFNNDVQVSGYILGQNVNAANDIAAQGVFRYHSLGLGGGAKGAMIECWWGDWDAMTFGINGGTFHVSPNRGTSGFFYTNSGSFSDARLKDDIRDTAVDALALICSTPVRQFALNEEGRRLMPYTPSEIPCGLVAQELETTIPLAVGVIAIADNAKNILDDRLTPYLFRAIQQLAERVTQLEKT